MISPYLLKYCPVCGGNEINVKQVYMGGSRFGIDLLCKTCESIIWIG